MPLRPPAGFISAFYDPLKVADAPTIDAASGGDAQASVTFTAPGNTGGAPITQYYAVSNPGQITGNAVSSPVTVTGLTNGTAYTFTVWALNSYGPSPYSGVSGSVTPAAQRAIFGGGATSGFVPNGTIDYISIASLGNALNFGTLTVSRSTLAACSSSTRGIFGGGTSGGGVNVLDYITIANIGSAIDFGDLVTPAFNLAACSSSTRGVFGGGYRVAQLGYVTIASLGNALNFGTLTITRYNTCSFSSTTRGLFCGGEGDGESSSGYYSTIDYITIATTGNAINFGNLTQAKRTGLGNCSSSTRGIIAGGANDTGTVNVIEYVTIATTGNAIDFGDLTGPQQQIAGTSSQTRGVFGGGDNGSSAAIQFITIASLGNSQNFGNLTVSRFYAAACSNAHGGLS